MICQNCGHNNKDGYIFCSKCGTKLQPSQEDKKKAFSDEMRRVSESVDRFGSEQTTQLEVNEEMENEETIILNDSGIIDDFENDETVILDEEPGVIDAFENDETVILNDSQNDISGFENDETVILDEDDGVTNDFENEETVILDNNNRFENENTVIMQDRDTPPTAPTFDYRTVYKEYRTDENAETAYIDHLRRLKELLDDGIITEDEFTRKKQQILGL